MIIWILPFISSDETNFLWGYGALLLTIHKKRCWMFNKSKTGLLPLWILVLSVCHAVWQATEITAMVYSHLSRKWEVEKQKKWLVAPSGGAENEGVARFSFFNNKTCCVLAKWQQWDEDKTDPSLKLTTNTHSHTKMNSQRMTLFISSQRLGELGSSPRWIRKL